MNFKELLLTEVDKLLESDNLCTCCSRCKAEVKFDKDTDVQNIVCPECANIFHLTASINFNK